VLEAEPPISHDRDRLGEYDSTDGQRAVDVRKRFAARGETFGPDLRSDTRRVDRQQHDVVPAPIDEIGGWLELIYIGAVDEALILERPTERRLSVITVIHRRLPFVSEGEMIEPLIPEI
jgi:hypothetical protein